MRLVTQYTVANVIVVRNLHAVKQNYVFKFDRIADDATFADERASAYKGTVSYLSFSPDYTGRTEIRRRSNFRRFVYPDPGSYFVIFPPVKRAGKSFNIFFN